MKMYDAMLLMETRTREKKRGGWGSKKKVVRKSTHGIRMSGAMVCMMYPVSWVRARSSLDQQLDDLGIAPEARQH